MTFKKLWDAEAKRNATKLCQWKRHGVKNASIQRYSSILDDQNGTCAICKKLPTKRKLALDHNHETGEIRGLLCFPCNYLTGIIEALKRQEPDKLELILNYLNKQPKEYVEEPTDTPRPRVQARRDRILEEMAEIQANTDSSFSELIKYMAELEGCSVTTIKRYLGLVK